MIGNRITDLVAALLVLLLVGDAKADLLRTLPNGWTRHANDTGGDIYQSKSGDEKIVVRAHSDDDLDAIALRLLQPSRPSGNPPSRDSFGHVGTAKGRSYMDMNADPWTMFQVFVLPSGVAETISVYSEYPVASAFGLTTAKRHENAIKAVERMVLAEEPVLVANLGQADTRPDATAVEDSAERDAESDNIVGPVKVDGVYQTTKPPVYIGTGGWSFSEKLYVFFDNGVVRKGLVGAPEQTNFAERGWEPSKWGNWRWSKSTDGAEVLWDTGKRETLGKGSQTFQLCKPGPLEPLRGRYQRTISPLGYNRVLFGPAHTFRMNYVPGGEDADQDREGTYSFQGYTMVLQLSGGSIERHGACFPGKGYDMLYLNGIRLTKDG